MPNRQFERFTFSMNPKDPNAVLNAKQIDAAIRQVVSQLQKEGERVHRSERYAQGGMINADYYVPAGSAQMALNAANEALERLRNPSGISFSSASPVSMSSWSGTILDPRMRAQIARLVDRSGGMFSTNDQGISSYMIDKGRVARNTGGQFVNASSYISRMIRSSNEQHVAGWESLMGQANINASYSDYDESERAAMESAAKSLKARRAKRAVTIAAEREETYARLERRRHREEARRQYEVDNPDDPIVMRRRNARVAAARAKRRRSVSKAGKFVGRFIVGALAGVLTFLGVSVGLLNRIRDAILTIGGKVREQNMGAQSYNLNVDTVQSWERFAAKRGYKKDTLVGAVGELHDKFSNPLFYSDEAFSGIAPFIKDDTAALAGAAAAGGDANMLKMLRTVIERLTDASKRGEAGGKFGIDPDEAFSQNLAALRKAVGSESATLFSEYWYDTRGSVDFDTWRSGNSSPEYQAGTLIHNGATRKAAEGTFDSINNMYGTYKAAGEDVLQSILGYVRDIVDMLGNFFAKTLAWQFPELAKQVQHKNAFINKQTGMLLDVAIPELSATADKAISAAGLTGSADEVIAMLEGRKLSADKVLYFKQHPEELQKIVAASNAIKAKKSVQKAMDNGNTESVRYNPAMAANAVGVDTWAAWSDVEAQAWSSAGDVTLPGISPNDNPSNRFGLPIPDLDKHAKFLQDPARFNRVISELNAALSKETNPSKIEKLLNRLLYTYSITGHSKEADQVYARLQAFYNSRARDLDSVKAAKAAIFKAGNAMRFWESIAPGTTDQRAATFEGIDARTQDIYDGLNELWGSVSSGTKGVGGPGVSIPESTTGVYLGQGANGINGGQGDAGNVILNQTINGQKTTTTVPLRRNPSGDRVGDINGGNTTAPYIDAINNAMNRQNY